MVNRDFGNAKQNSKPAEPIGVKRAAETSREPETLKARSWVVRGGSFAVAASAARGKGGE